MGTSTNIYYHTNCGSIHTNNVDSSTTQTKRCIIVFHVELPSNCRPCKIVSHTNSFMSHGYISWAVGCPFRPSFSSIPCLTYQGYLYTSNLLKQDTQMGRQTLLDRHCKTDTARQALQDRHCWTDSARQTLLDRHCKTDNAGVIVNKLHCKNVVGWPPTDHAPTIYQPDPPTTKDPFVPWWISW